MQQITERIFIAPSEFLPVAEVTGALNVAFDLQPYSPFGGEYSKVGLVDGPGNLPGTLVAAVLMLEQLLERNNRVVVFCHMGVSRSPIVVATYLAYRSKNMTIDEAIKMVKSRRDKVDPAPALRDLAMLALRQLRPKSFP